MSADYKQGERTLRLTLKWSRSIRHFVRPFLSPTQNRKEEEVEEEEGKRIEIESNARYVHRCSLLFVVDSLYIPVDFVSLTKFDGSREKRVYGKSLVKRP